MENTRSYRISYRAEDFKAQKNLFVAYSLWQAWFRSNPIEVQTDDLLSKGHYSLISGISEIEFRLYLLPVDIWKITMNDSKTSITIDFGSGMVTYYAMCHEEGIETMITELCGTTVDYPRVTLSTFVERNNVRSIWNDEPIEKEILRRLFSLPGGIYKDCGIAVATDGKVATIYDTNEAAGRNISDILRYDSVSNTFVGFSRMNKRFVEYNLSEVDKKYLVEFIDQIRE